MLIQGVNSICRQCLDSVGWVTRRGIRPVQYSAPNPLGIAYSRQPFLHSDSPPRLFHFFIAHFSTIVYESWPRELF